MARFAPLLRPLVARAIPRTARAAPLSYLASRSSPIVSSAAPSLKWTAVRTYAASGGLTKEDIQKRVMEVMESFEKVNDKKLTPSASFTSDLGLDSLDAVEVVMAIEEEFGIEIPDDEADAITSVNEAIEYISKSPEAQ